MKNILFRGKRADNGEWIEGFFLCADERTFISTEPECLIRDWEPKKEYSFGKFFEVIPETVGQYTGQKDENDTKIFKDDVVNSAREEELAVIKWDDFTARFIIEFDGIVTDFDNYYASDLEVVGNIHDNPELSEAQG